MKLVITDDLENKVVIPIDDIEKIVIRPGYTDVIIKESVSEEVYDQYVEECMKIYPEQFDPIMSLTWFTESPLTFTYEN